MLEIVAKFDEMEIEGKDVKSEDLQGLPHPLLKSPIENPLELQLKMFLEHLENVSLGKNSTLHLIISSKLSRQQKRELLRTSKKYKKKIADVQGISPYILQAQDTS